MNIRGERSDFYVELLSKSLSNYDSIDAQH